MDEVLVEVVTDNEDAISDPASGPGELLQSHLCALLRSCLVRWLRPVLRSSSSSLLLKGLVLVDLVFQSDHGVDRCQGQDQDQR